MPIVSISEAARLTGKNRKTIQKYVADGQLSLSMDGQANGQVKGIEISELMRVFGPLTGHPTLPMDRPNGQQVAPLPDQSFQAEKDALERVIAAQQGTIDTLKGQVDELREEKRELKAQVAGLLEDRRPKPAAPSPATAPAQAAKAPVPAQPNIWTWITVGLGLGAAVVFALLIMAQNR